MPKEDKGMGKVKEVFKVNEEKERIHLVINGVDEGFSGCLTHRQLLEKYPECECETITYEMDDGFDEEDNPIIIVRSYLAIYINRK